jgi:hypothetical protein
MPKLKVSQPTQTALDAGTLQMLRVQLPDGNVVEALPFSAWFWEHGHGLSYANKADHRRVYEAALQQIGTILPAVKECTCQDH